MWLVADFAREYGIREHEFWALSPAEAWPLIAGLSEQSRTLPILLREMREIGRHTATVPTDEHGAPDVERYNALLRRMGGQVVIPDE